MTSEYILYLFSSFLAISKVESFHSICKLGFEECTCLWCWQRWRRFRGKDCTAFRMWVWWGMIVQKWIFLFLYTYILEQWILLRVVWAWWFNLSANPYFGQIPCNRVVSHARISWWLSLRSWMLPYMFCLLSFPSICHLLGHAMCMVHTLDFLFIPWCISWSKVQMITVTQLVLVLLILLFMAII